MKALSIFPPQIAFNLVMGLLGGLGLQITPDTVHAWLGLALCVLVLGNILFHPWVISAFRTAGQVLRLSPADSDAVAQRVLALLPQPTDISGAIGDLATRVDTLAGHPLFDPKIVAGIGALIERAQSNSTDNPPGQANDVTGAQNGAGADVNKPAADASSGSAAAATGGVVQTSQSGFGRLVIAGTIVAFCLLLFVASHAHAQSLCVKRADVVSLLAEKYGEVLVAHGDATDADSAPVEMYASKDGKTFTFVHVEAGGAIACLIGDGKNWQIVPDVTYPPIPPKGDPS